MHQFPPPPLVFVMASLLIISYESTEDRHFETVDISIFLAKIHKFYFLFCPSLDLLHLANLGMLEWTDP